MVELSNYCGEPLQNLLEIKYKNWKGEISNRIIIPHKIWFGGSDYHKEIQWFMKAYDIDKCDNRDFAIKDIIEFMKHEEDWHEKDYFILDKLKNYMSKTKVHLYDMEEDSKVLSDNELKKRGWRISKCGCQRQQTTRNIKNVTCKICRRKYQEEQ